MTAARWLAHAAFTGLLVLSLSDAARAQAATEAPGEPRCHAGAYRFDDGSVVTVAAVGDAGKLRWRTMQGRVGLLERAADGGWRSTLGWTGRDDGVAVAFGGCDEARIAFDGRTGEKIAFDAIETRFAGNGVELRGRLVLPKGAGAVPIAVEVHGSEDSSAVDLNYFQDLLPAHGIGVFVYDKRGTGKSSGKYTQDFHLLSDDAKAAFAEARRLAGTRAGRIGYHGGSQAGWVAPLAASKTADVGFVVVGYGLAEGALAEDREQVLLDLRQAGYADPAVLAQAREVTDATAVVVASRGARGWEQLDAVRAKYGKAPWWKAMQGEFTGMVVGHTKEELTAMAPKVEQGTSWDYDPMPVLRALRVPLLWVLAAEDREAPPAETRRRLLGLTQQDRPITVVEFPDTDHGILEFETGADGKRVPVRAAEGYFPLQIEWIRTGRLGHDTYGRGRVLAQPPMVTP